MNIAATIRGTSSKPAIQIVSYGPDLSPFLIADFFYGYHYGNTVVNAEQMTRREFARMVKRGKLICHSVYAGELLIAVFGTAIRHDDEGAYIEIAFFLGDLGRNFRDVLRAMAMRTYWVARLEQQSRFEYRKNVRMRARGRKGWRRALKMVGVRIDHDGWCRDFDPIERWRGK